MSSATICTAILAKDEAGRDLEGVLRSAFLYSAAVLVLDDNSHDETAKISRNLGCQVRGRSVLKDPAWGAEASARAELWAWGAEVAGDGWLLIQDADMILHGDPRQLTETWDLNAWGFILRDLWSETEFRVDGPWAMGPQFARPWLFRPDACPEPQWSTRGLHPGHAPSNFPLVMGIAPPDTYWWEHRAYVNPERRQKKHAQYLAHADKLSQQEIAHAMSITD